MELRVVSVQDGLRLTPAGVAPRLERAFAVSVGRGMLDLLRFGLPIGANPALAWLREKAQKQMMLYLRILRRGEEPTTALHLPMAEAAAWLDSMPPIMGDISITASQIVSWVESLEPALKWLAMRESCTPEAWLCRLGEGGNSWVCSAST